jgi:hypothetical protein
MIGLDHRRPRHRAQISRILHQAQMVLAACLPHHALDDSAGIVGLPVPGRGIEDDEKRHFRLHCGHGSVVDQ